MIDADIIPVMASGAVIDSRRRGNPAFEMPAHTGGAAIVARLRGPIARRIAQALLAAAVTAGAALAMSVALLVGSTPVTGASTSVPAPQEDGSVALAGWLGVATDPATTIAVVDPALRDELVAYGVPAERLADDGRLVVVAADPDPADLARFGELAVRDRDGVLASRTDAGLADNPRLVASPEVRAVIRAGTLDIRSMAVLAVLAGRGPVVVVAVPELPGETPQLPRHTVVLEGLDTATQDWLRAQRAPYAPAIEATGAETTLTWPVPAPDTLDG